jgi:hypothetical protein
MDMVYFDGLEGMGNGGGPPGIAEAMLHQASHRAVLSFSFGRCFHLHLAGAFILIWLVRSSSFGWCFHFHLDAPHQ